MSFEFDSDLTDLSSDDETPLANTYGTQASSAKPKPVPTKRLKDANPPRLTRCRVETVSTVTLLSRLQDNLIDVNPEYQRGVVWSEVNQGYLIDSLMHNYVVFPIIFALKVREDGVNTRVCIDGKQRLTAIQRFMENKISYRDSQLNREMWYDKAPKGKKANNIISAAQRTRFRDTPITIYDYECVTVEDEREIFQRVQNGVALTAHERLKPINGPNADLVREMHKSASTALQELLAWKKAKGKDFFMLAQIAVLINHHLSAVKGACPAAGLGLPRVEIFLRGKTAPTPKLRKAVLGVMDTLNCLIDTPDGRQVFPSIQPLCFVMSGFMIYLYRSKFSLLQLADVVNRMKMAHAKPVYKDLASFVMNKVKELKLPSDGNGVASSVTFDGQREQSVASTSRLPDVAVKRKRSTDDSDGEEVDQLEEEEYEAPKKKAIPARRKVPRIADSEDEDDGHVIPSPPRPKTAARTSVKKLALAKGSASGSTPSSKAKTTVKRSAAKVGTSAAASKPPAKQKASVAAKETTMSQIGKPSVKPTAPTRTTKPTTSGTAAASSSQSLFDRETSLQKSTSSRSPMLLPSPSMAAVSAPLPTSRPPARPSNLSRPSTPMLGSHKPSPFDVKVESRQSPTIPVQTPPAQTPAPHSARLASLHAIQAKIAAENLRRQRSSPNPPLSTPSSRSQDPRRRQSVNTMQVPPNDPDAQLHLQLDRIETLLTPPASSASPAPPRGATASAPPARPPPGQRPQTSSSALDVNMADGTRDILGNAEPFSRTVHTRPPQHEPPIQYITAPPAPPPVPPINTNVDQYRDVATSGGSAGQYPSQAMSQASPGTVQPPSASVTTKDSFLKGMKIPKMPAAMAPFSPQSASATSRGSGSFRDWYDDRDRGYHPDEERYYRPYGGDRQMDRRSRRE